jgi:Cu+-exporting ATPase
MNLAPKTALVKKDGREMLLPVEDINVGDLAIIKAGERIPVDGTVFHGASYVDQSMSLENLFPSIR